jgi:phenylacetate-CoA ligase
VAPPARFAIVPALCSARVPASWGRCVSLCVGWSGRRSRRSLVTRSVGCERWCGSRRRVFHREWFAGSSVDPASCRPPEDAAAAPFPFGARVGPAPCLSPEVDVGRLMPVAPLAGGVGSWGPGSSAFELSALQRQWSWFGMPHRRGVWSDDRPGTVAEAGPGGRTLRSRCVLTHFVGTSQRAA